MSKTPEDVAEPGVTIPLRGRYTLLLYVIFWGWLLARWSNDWLLPEGIGVPHGRSFIDPVVMEERGGVDELHDGGQELGIAPAPGARARH